MRRVVKPILEILAGIPSVVLAYFAITFINPNIVVRLFDPRDKAFTMLAAGIAVGVLTVPIIASVAEDALRAVPMSLREASFGLGAQRAQTTFRVVFPAGVSGIVAALILGISRAIGETMVVAIAAGAVGGALFHFTPLEPGQTMTAAMAGLSFGSDQVAGNEAAFQSLFFIGALLFVMTLGLNVLGDKLVNRVREVVLTMALTTIDSAAGRGPVRHRRAHQSRASTCAARVIEGLLIARSLFAADARRADRRHDPTQLARVDRPRARTSSPSG